MKLNLKSLVFMLLIAGLVLTGCAAPAPTAAPGSGAPATEAVQWLPKRLLKLRLSHQLLPSLLNCGPTMAILALPRLV